MQAAQYFYANAKDKISAKGDLPDFFVYFLTVECGDDFATTVSIKKCYHACDLSSPSWLASHLSNGLKSKPKRFVRRDGGYRLEHHRRSEIEGLLGCELSSLQTSATLNGLESKLPVGNERDFLQETTKCFAAGAFRAAVVMCWNLVLHHMQTYILQDFVRLASFNATLSRNTDTRVKVKSVHKQDDFTEMPENKFLLFCRESKLISTPIFKKLDRSLDDRNNAAHPSGVRVTPKFAEAYIEDLVQNTILKYQL